MTGTLNATRIWTVLAVLSLVFTGMLLSAPAAIADTYQTYDLAWTGAYLGNNASATGVMTLDLTTLANPVLDPIHDIKSDISSLTVTVTGASSGNGTWTLDDLAYTFWNTNGFTLDMQGPVAQELYFVQGDFNLFFVSPGPIGTIFMTLTSDGGKGDPMVLTTFEPAVSTPEPSTFFFLLGGLVVVIGFVSMRPRVA